MTHQNVIDLDSDKIVVFECFQFETAAVKLSIGTEFRSCTFCWSLEIQKWCWSMLQVLYFFLALVMGNDFLLSCWMLQGPDLLRKVQLHAVPCMTAVKMTKFTAHRGGR